VGCLYDHGNEVSGSVKGAEFLYQDYFLLEGSAPQSFILTWPKGKLEEREQC
jgi:hypothetical protein